jgi:hypothetical protein
MSTLFLSESAVLDRSDSDSSYSAPEEGELPSSMDIDEEASLASDDDQPPTPGSSDEEDPFMAEMHKRVDDLMEGSRVIESIALQVVEQLPFQPAFPLAEQHVQMFEEIAEFLEELVREPLLEHVIKEEKAKARKAKRALKAQQQQQ